MPYPRLPEITSATAKFELIHRILHSTKQVLCIAASFAAKTILNQEHYLEVNATFTRLYSMAPSLEDCPNEVIENIILLLDLVDIRSIRQSCRSLATKSTQDHWKSFYRAKRVDITPSALRSFIDATQSNRLGCLVQDLTLVGLTEASKSSRPSIDSEETEVSLLSQALSNIAASKRGVGRVSLRLEVAVVQVDTDQRLLPVAASKTEWRFVWQCAAQTFQTVVRALAASRLPLEKLDVFGNRQLQCCSVSCDELSRIGFQDKRLTMSLSSLKALSISISDRLVDVPPPTFSESDENITRDAKEKLMSPSNFTGLVQMLSLDSLENVEIHYFRLDSARSFVGLPYDHHELLLKQVARSKKLPKLKQCSLRGLYIDEKDLLAFLQRTTPRRLLMENITLSSGTFGSVFDYCTCETTDVEAMCLDDLFEKHQKLYFPIQVGNGELPRHPPIRGSPVTTSLHRMGAEVKQGIIYRYHEGRTLDTPRTRNLIRQRYKDYGPLEL